MSVDNQEAAKGRGGESAMQERHRLAGRLKETVCHEGQQQNGVAGQPGRINAVRRLKRRGDYTCRDRHQRGNVEWRREDLTLPRLSSSRIT